MQIISTAIINKILTFWWYTYSASNLHFEKMFLRRDGAADGVAEMHYFVSVSKQMNDIAEVDVFVEEDIYRDGVGVPSTFFLKLFTWFSHKSACVFSLLL